MSRTWTPALLGALILLALSLLPIARVGAQAVTSVTVSPSVVPVPLNATKQTAILVTATVSGLAAGTTASCVGTLSEEPSGTTISTSPPVNTSPASTSGSTSVSIQFLVPGATPPGPAQAAVNCNGSTATTSFRITSLVGVAVSPWTIPVGGVATVTTMIAAAGPLVATPCTLTLTDPSGTAPPIQTQTISVSGGSATTPAANAQTVTIPNTAPLGTANAAVSCVVVGTGTAGDTTDFTVTDPSTVTILGFTAPALVGSPLNVTSVTLPGFSCVALFTPPAGPRIASNPGLADASGTAVNLINLPPGLQPGVGALSVTCADPNNSGNSANSAAQVVTLVSAAALPTNTALPTATVLPSTPPLTISASLTNVASPLIAGSLVTVTVVSLPGAACALGGISAGGSRLAITEASGAGTVPPSGSLALSFRLPAGITDGTAVVIASCSSGGSSATAQVTVPVGVGQGEQNCSAPAAPAAAPPTPVAGAGGAYTGSAGTPVQFVGSAVPSTNAVLTSCVWTFGDGGRATVLNPVHMYAASGTYTATLQITDSAGLSASATATVTISGFVPQCSLPALTGTSALVPCAAVSVCSSGALQAGCLPACASLAAPAALCPRPGVQVAVLTGGPYQAAVSQSISFHASASVSATRRVCTEDITFGSGAPICNLVPDDARPSPLGYLWDFGDGSQATGDTVGHAYGQAGIYTVTLTVYLDDGSTASATTSATITAAGSG